MPLARPCAGPSASGTRAARTLFPGHGCRETAQGLWQGRRRRMNSLPPRCCGCAGWLGRSDGRGRPPRGWRRCSQPPQGPFLCHPSSAATRAGNAAASACERAAQQSRRRSRRAPRRRGLPRAQEAAARDSHCRADDPDGPGASRVTGHKGGGRACANNGHVCARALQAEPRLSRAAGGWVADRVPPLAKPRPHNRAWQHACRQQRALRQVAREARAVLVLRELHGMCSSPHPMILFRSDLGVAFPCIY